MKSSLDIHFVIKMSDTFRRLRGHFQVGGVKNKN